jgi:hypothetical protein
VTALIIRTRRISIDATRTLLRVGRNALMAAFARADHARWTSSTGLEPWWDERTRILASLIPPSSRVIEFGAGRRQLEQYLPATCVYTPSDLSERGPGTIVCDLNRRPLPDLRAVAPTVAVFGGVLEYVKSVDAVVTWLVHHGIEDFVVSFDAMPSAPHVPERLRERMRRLRNGYMNNLTEPELKSVFASFGLQCAEERRWNKQGIYRFARRIDPGMSNVSVVFLGTRTYGTELANTDHDHTQPLASVPDDRHPFDDRDRRLGWRGPQDGRHPDR